MSPWFRPAPLPLLPKGHWCPGGSFLEIRRFDGEPAQFRNFFTRPQPNTTKQFGDFRSQAFTPAALVLCSVAQDLAHFFLHASAMSLVSSLALGSHRCFTAPDDQLCHGLTSRCDIMLSHIVPGGARYIFRDVVPSTTLRDIFA